MLKFNKASFDVQMKVGVVFLLLVFQQTYPNCVTSKVKSKTTGYLADSRRILATMYLNKGNEEQRKAAEIRSKYNQLIYLYIISLILCLCIQAFF